MSGVELLPCPFCGGTPGMAHSYDADGCYWARVRCDACGAQTRGRWASNRGDACPIFYGEVRSEWNQRTASACGEAA